MVIPSSKEAKIQIFYAQNNGFEDVQIIRFIFAE